MAQLVKNLPVVRETWVQSLVMEQRSYNCHGMAKIKKEQIIVNIITSR